MEQLQMTPVRNFCNTEVRRKLTVALSQSEWSTIVDGVFVPVCDTLRISVGNSVHDYRRYK